MVESETPFGRMAFPGDDVELTGRLAFNILAYHEARVSSRLLATSGSVPSKPVLRFLAFGTTCVGAGDAGESVCGTRRREQRILGGFSRILDWTNKF
jgi:hypothetical protein